MLNSLIGLIIFERTWYNTRRFRNHPDEVHASFPAYCRVDRKEWKKWKFYPGAITLLVPRMLIGISLIIILAGLVKILLLWHPSNAPILGCRKFLIHFCLKVVSFLITTITFFCWMSEKTIDITKTPLGNYSQYLGYEQNSAKAEEKPLSMIVCNHTGFLEILNMC